MNYHIDYGTETNASCRFSKKSQYIKKCVVLEMENKTDFENSMNDYLSDGYKVEASSCNSKYYKAILVLEENN